MNVQVVEETFALAQTVGSDENVMRDVVLCSSGNSWSHENIEAMRTLGNIHTGGNLDMGIFGRKDISLATKLAARAPLANVVLHAVRSCAFDVSRPPAHPQLPKLLHAWL